MKKLVSCDEVSIETPEHVNIYYELAGPGSRLFAALLDHLILLLSVAFAVVLAWSLYRQIPTSSVSVTVLVITLGAPLLLLVAYFSIFEVLWNGQTPGKRAAGLRVMRDDGTPAAPIDLVLRNTVRIVDFLPYFYFTGALVAFLDERSRRLGDLAAGTVVVKLRRSELPETVFLSLPTDSASDHLTSLLRPVARTMSPEERTTLERFLARRSELSPDVRVAMSHRILAALRPKLPTEIIEIAGDDPEAIFEALAKASRQTAERV